VPDHALTDHALPHSVSHPTSSHPTSFCPTFLIDSYLRPGEVFHFARRRLVPGGVSPLHDHDYHECFWVERGTLLHRVNGEARRLEPGHCVFVRPLDRHALEAVGPVPCRITNVALPSASAAHLVARYADELAGRLFWSEAPLPETLALDEPGRARLERLANELDVGPRCLARLEGFLLELCTRVAGEVLEMPAEVPPWLASACRAARDPAVFRRGAVGFVEAAGRSHEHVCRAARRHLGRSPSAYVNGLRMEHASRRLTGSDESIVQIALDCGIGNLSHFYRLFRARFGTTPRDYRQRYRRDPVTARPS